MDVVLEQRGQGILIDLNNGEERGSAANFTSREIEEEKRIVREAMADGAMGLASGLSYVPNIYMSTEELTELARKSPRREASMPRTPAQSTARIPRQFRRPFRLARKPGFRFTFSI
jgi:N-acyl-D-aspartate/D-glutamate deacylase